MSLGENIKNHRQRCGLSQEKLAELVGISRQAVTKWEADLSAPSCENLLRLAEIFGTSADLLLPSTGESGNSVVEQAYQLYKIIEERKAAERRRRLISRVKHALNLLAAFLICYLVYCFVMYDPETTLLGFFYAPFFGEDSYLFGWLYTSRLVFPSVLITILPALFGWHRFSYTAFGGYQAGILLGMLFGPNPAGAFWGHTHYGWAIWGGIFLFSMVMGITLERLHKQRASRHWFCLWAIGCVVGAVAVTVFVVLSKVG